MSAASLRHPMDWPRLSLEAPGRSLIEASAGTGKTWTIAVLYLRLVLEQERSPRQVVVTTFTNAAADELRARLRARLRWAEARAAADSAEAGAGSDTEIEVETWLQARWREDAPRRRVDLQRLRLALMELDLAPITTLHGLCQRILDDHPFAAGVPLQGGDLVALDDLVDELATDLLRRLQQGDAAGEPLIRWQARAQLEDLSLATLAQRLKLLLRPGHVVYCRPDAEIRAVLDPAWAPRLRALVDNDAWFNKDCSLRDYWRNLAGIIENPDAALPSKHTDNGLANAKKLTGISAKGKLAAEVLAAVDYSVAVVPMLKYLREHPARRFWFAVAEWARAQLQARLATLGRRTFDQQLTAVHDALTKEQARGARPLADALFRAWPVALVDEFQDTDGVQYGILDRIYRQGDGARRGRLVMIGDPKQAIYRFRGGDIDAYLRAAEEVDADGYTTLGTNQRSSRALVAALNQFHEVAGTALAADVDTARIHYAPVQASGRPDRQPYRIEGEDCTRPLVVHHYDIAPRATEARRQAALVACADQVAEVLQSGRHRIGGEAIQPSRLAVLVPVNRQLVQLRELLRARGVACVTSARDSVFAGDSARELQVLLHAIAHADDLAPMRAAVATRLWGGDYAMLRALGDEPARWQAIRAFFRDAWQRWQARGVQAAVDALIERIAGAQLATVAGERVLTDLRHLGELLQGRAEQVAGVEELLAWLGEQRHAGGSDGDDAQQLRIESDAERVQLLTLHASKGLEFDLVFLPLMWDHDERPGAGLYVVSGEDSEHRRIDVGLDARETEKKELQDERFRVLYVALTRAVHACHVYALPWDRPAHAGEKAAPASGTARSALDVMLERLQPPLGSADLRSTTPNIEWRPGWPTPTTHTARVAVPALPPLPRHSRPLPTPAPGPLPGRHSFTTLTRGLARAALDPEAPAGDEAEVGDGYLPDRAALDPGAEALLPPMPAHPELVALAKVRGADFGNAVHAILERRQPGRAMAEQRELIREQLVAANIRHRDLPGDALANLLSARLQAVLDTPLATPDGPRLGALAAAQLRAEMEFNFILDGASLERLRRCASEHGDADLVPTGQRLLAGLMTGKIDLVFEHGGRCHVLDYKGNHLGDAVADYQGEALAQQMQHAHYRFQALIYTVALERYLRQRLPGYQRASHLGDCWYVFIRAVGLAPGAGVWRHRFDDALLDAVQRELAATTTEARP